MSLVRLQKFLSEAGVASRRAAEELIAAGKVRVNEKVVTKLGTTVDPIRDVVRVRNKIVKPVKKGVILFHKPKGVVSTMSDPEGRPCIADYLTKRYRSYFPVGRLDYDSTGLVILTNDGELSERLLHPRFGAERVYEVRVSGVIREQDLRKLRRGVRLEDGVIKANAELISSDRDSSWVRVKISEGRNRVIRRMMEKLHHPVLKLKRISHGPIQLGRIKLGEIRALSEREYQSLRNHVLQKG